MLAAPAIAQDKGPGVKVGTLTCALVQETNFIIGSKATLNCSYDP
ncbi:MAG: DUF992 domain-containing protein, partial [Roseibium sp.]